MSHASRFGKIGDPASGQILPTWGQALPSAVLVDDEWAPLNDGLVPCKRVTSRTSS